MIKFDKEKIFDTKNYENFEEFMDELFWNDLYIEVLDTYYLHDTNKNDWYMIETRYNYAQIEKLFNDGKSIRFDEVKDEDLIKELEEVFVG